jgi:hydrogenase expression/formation protein HypE
VSILLADRAEQLKHLFGGSLEGVKRISDRFGEMLSVVPDARVALGSVPEGTISSMHDPTEGGLAGALHEVADAADKGFEIDEEAVACIGC